MDTGEFNTGFREYLAGVPFDVQPEDYRAMESRLALIEQMAEVQGSSVVVYDFYRQNYLLRKVRFSEQLGHEQEMADQEGLGYFVSLVHPEDAPVILDTYLKAFGFLESLPAQEKKSFKLVYTFRSRGKDGSYHVLVARGFASKQIAEQLYISVNTVNNHRQKILEKTRASNTAEAVAYARTLGLV